MSSWRNCLVGLKSWSRKRKMKIRSRRNICLLWKRLSLYWEANWRKKGTWWRGLKRRWPKYRKMQAIRSTLSTLMSRIRNRIPFRAKSCLPIWSDRWCLQKWGRSNPRRHSRRNPHPQSRLKGFNSLSLSNNWTTKTFSKCTHHDLPSHNSP